MDKPDELNCVGQTKLEMYCFPHLMSQWEPAGQHADIWGFQGAVLLAIHNQTGRGKMDRDMERKNVRHACTRVLFSCR